MPVAIIITHTTIPAIIERETDSELLKEINRLNFTSETLSIEGVKKWLNNMPAPAGWYKSRENAKAAAELARDRAIRSPEPITPEFIRDARKKHLNMTRVQFGRAIGFNGNDNTINKTVHQIETDPTKTLNKQKQDILFTLLAERGFSFSETEKD